MEANRKSSRRTKVIGAVVSITSVFCGGSAIADEDDAAVLAGFKAFATTEVPRMCELLTARLSRTPRSSRNTGETIVVSGFDKMLDDYKYDVRRTDSLVSPHVGTIELFGRFFSGRVAVSNCETHSMKPSLKMCLGLGALIVTEGTQITATRVAFQFTYARQDGKWILDASSADPAKARVKSDDTETLLSAEWAAYAGGATNTPPATAPP